ncbi:hypothetical protein [Paraglaciecola polaris]|uniref:Uncharacterized protein n=1 Tax=Paraglaciecola polaris LMG 21857 TaxID=1129793 RepID=K6Z8S1_9ALTE|nr:hypothetical protein [Paraglaciecola polaris]GAC32571.1 hypothetical protein GPLA_1657 [Paraglaciecola polaris LMG 21857]|tara:strand:- start:18719 stop:19150 length:432 start_codon:yes stop_codon:yes gene_type:complete
MSSSTYFRQRFTLASRIVLALCVLLPFYPAIAHKDAWQFSHTEASVLLYSAQNEVTEQNILTQLPTKARASKPISDKQSAARLLSADQRINMRSAVQNLPLVWLGSCIFLGLFVVYRALERRYFQQYFRQPKPRICMSQRYHL